MEEGNTFSNEALVRADDNDNNNNLTNALVYSTGLHYNALHFSPNEEYELFRRKHHVAESYRGPVYVAEDIQVPCGECGCPVDPITRIPVSDNTYRKIYFHPECIKCAICKYHSLTINYFLINDARHSHEPIVVCANCVSNGYVTLHSDSDNINTNALITATHGKRTSHVNKQFRRNNVGGKANNGLMERAKNKSTRSRDDNVSREYNINNDNNSKSNANSSNVYTAYMQSAMHDKSINLPCIPGCTPPSLSLKGNVHTTRNTTPRAIALIHRQQYYTQNDCNLLMHPPVVEESRDNEQSKQRDSSHEGSNRRRSSRFSSRIVKKLEDDTHTQRAHVPKIKPCESLCETIDQYKEIAYLKALLSI